MLSDDAIKCGPNSKALPHWPGDGGGGVGWGGGEGRGKVFLRKEQQGEKVNRFLEHTAGTRSLSYTDQFLIDLLPF